jgi:hypothetical protein
MMQYHSLVPPKNKVTMHPYPSIRPPCTISVLGTAALCSTCQLTNVPTCSQLRERDACSAVRPLSQDPAMPGMGAVRPSISQYGNGPKQPFAG